MSNNTEYFSPDVLESQEHLSLDILSKMNPVGEWDLKPRPTANFIDLMNWVQESFGEALDNDRTPLNNFVQNRIVIDGQFLHFCQEHNVTVECLYKDSIISWRTDHDYEKFFMQGVFLIKFQGVEFLHAALFHKGNQNEDEVSFFIVVSDNNYESYVQFRNQFDDWVMQRDRSNLHIRVVDGDDIPYTKDANIPTNPKMQNNKVTIFEYFFQNNIAYPLYFSIDKQLLQDEMQVFFLLSLYLYL